MLYLKERKEFEKWMMRFEVRAKNCHTSVPASRRGRNQDHGETQVAFSAPQMRLMFGAF
jgi:hypothetical protein